jgi:HAD superfamily hydrolase (TIGR01450 family)
MTVVTPLSQAYDVALLDLDGVVYVGPAAVDHASAALADARAAGMSLAFVTNNAARTPSVVAAHLRDLGISAAADEVVTSAQAAARLLAGDLPAGSAVLVVGGAGLEEALRERGLTPVASMSDHPVAVVQGFAPHVDWAMLAEGSYAVAAGVPWVAANLDRTIPTARGRAPGNGALVDAIRAATGREPVVAGKPEPPMHREAMLRTGARRPLVVGDRLDTDIEGARRAGVDSLLVLTGVTDPHDVVHAPEALRPTYIGHDLRALAADAASLRVAAGADRQGRWKATVEGSAVHLDEIADPTPSGHTDRLDLLRALCGAVWAADTGVAGVGEALARVGW